MLATSNQDEKDLQVTEIHPNSPIKNKSTSGRQISKQNFFGFGEFSRPKSKRLSLERKQKRGKRNASLD